MGYSLSAHNTTFVRLHESATNQITSNTARDQSEQRQVKGLLDLLPDHRFILLLLAYFFEDIVSCFWLIDEFSLRARYGKWRAKILLEGSEQLERDLHYLPALLFQVLAQAVDSLPLEHPTAQALQLSDYESSDRLAHVFHAAGEKLVQVLGRHDPSQSSVEHDLLSAVWLKNSGRGTDTWNRVGSAIIQAQELGLHSLSVAPKATSGDVKSDLIEFWELEGKKRLWARLFIVDSMSLALGRPRFIHREEVSTPPPTNCDYPPDTTKGVPLPYDNSSGAIIVALLKISHLIHDVLTGIARHDFVNDYEKLRAIHDHIYDMRQNVPPSSIILTAASPKDAIYAEIGRLMLLNQINVVIVALHRPFVAAIVTSRVAAIEAALDQLQCQQKIFELIPYSQYKLYTTAFYTIDAAIFLAGMTTSQPQSCIRFQDKILFSMAKAIKRLNEMKTRNRLAGSAYDIIRRCYESIQTVLSVAVAGHEEPTTNLQETSPIDTGFGGELYIPPPEQPSSQNLQSIFGPSHDPGYLPISTPHNPDLPELEMEAIFESGSMFEYLTWPT